MDYTYNFPVSHMDNAYTLNMDNMWIKNRFYNLCFYNLFVNFKWEYSLNSKLQKPFVPLYEEMLSSFSLLTKVKWQKCTCLIDFDFPLDF